MCSLKKSPTGRTMVMGKKLGKADGAGCRRHRRQGEPGVCPLCLRERLSRLSPSATLPSVVAREGAASPSSSCSDSEASSTEASTGVSSGSASPGFHQEIKRAARPSLLMRHERVVAVEGDGVVVVMRRRRERPPTSFWAKLLRAATGGKKAVDGCSLAHSKTIDAAGESRSAADTKWIIF